jgi:hypothetical protein
LLVLMDTYAQMAANLAVIPVLAQFGGYSQLAVVAC